MWIESHEDAIRRCWLPDKIIRQGGFNCLSEMSFSLGIVFQKEEFNKIVAKKCTEEQIELEQFVKYSRTAPQSQHCQRESHPAWITSCLYLIKQDILIIKSIFSKNICIPIPTVDAQYLICECDVNDCLLTSSVVKLNFIHSSMDKFHTSTHLPTSWCGSGNVKRLRCALLFHVCTLNFTVYYNLCLP